ncbi:hypothetical protein BFJ67_g15211 [Fusarium oxysporum f. sp. cepae]|nr:hypothetical protein BFJ67_g15211 [Fusarium oxysporum f. sp. cepae]
MDADKQIHLIARAEYAEPVSSANGKARSEFERSANCPTTHPILHMLELGN